MTAPQFHLMLNHIPVIGTLFVVVALAAGVMFRSAPLQRFGLVVLVGVALVAVPVFLSGEPTEERVERLAGVSSSSIEAHEGAARIATIALGFLGLLALAGLIRGRARATVRGFASVVLVLTLGLSGLLAWTAHLGGRIRHPEIRASAAGDTAVESSYEGDHH
jgi:hypothetical protein